MSEWIFVQHRKRGRAHFDGYTPVPRFSFYKTNNIRYLFYYSTFGTVGHPSCASGKRWHTSKGGRNMCVFIYLCMMPSMLCRYHRARSASKQTVGYLVRPSIGWSVVPASPASQSVVKCGGRRCQVTDRHGPSKVHLKAEEKGPFGRKI